MLRMPVCWIVMLLVIVGTCDSGWAVDIPIANSSFEGPTVVPGEFPAVPMVGQWIEMNLDAEGSTNTGVFANSLAASDDHVVNAKGLQLAFLGSEQGNALEQDLNTTYQVGCDYHLTVGVGVSSKFPPSTQEPIDTLELVLYYVDDVNTVDIVHHTVPATDLSSTVLLGFTVNLPKVRETDAWAGKTVGVAIRATGVAGGFWDLDNVRLVESLAVMVPIANASFEIPAVDPDAFPALPMVDQWIEADLDVEGSTNAGVFANTPGYSTDHISNTDGDQLAFLGSEQGNALDQDLKAIYQIGSSYRLTAAVGVLGRFPPAGQDSLELALFYLDEGNPVAIIATAVPAMDLSSTRLQEFSVYLPTVDQGDPWAGRTVGVGLHAVGMAGGFWDLDHLRLAQSTPQTELVLD